MRESTATSNPPGRAGRVILLAACVLYSAALALMSLMPVSRGSALAATATRRAINNLLHVPAYGLLAWLYVAQFRGWLASGRTLRPKAAAAGCIAAIGFGAIMEWAQRFVPGRKGTAADFMLNVAGVAAALSLLWLVGARKRRGRLPAPVPANEANS